MTTAAFVEEQFSTAGADLRPVEMGAWTLEYLGPGLRVQVRVNHRGPSADLSGWISPAVAARVFLVPMVRGGTPVEASLSASGRFEFVRVPRGGGHRLTFITETAERPFMTPPFWI